MNIEDAKKLNEGDIITVRLVVKSGLDSAGDVNCGKTVAGTDIWVSPDQIISVEAAPLKVGDRVRVKGDCHIRKIVFIEDQIAVSVYKDANGVMDSKTNELSCLELMP